MVGLKDSEVRESDVTLRALHKALIRVGKPSLEESCYAIREIWPEMRYPKVISIFMTSPYINLTLSRVMSGVWDVRAKFKKDRTLQVYIQLKSSPRET